jgi:hypothetical protein
MYGQAAYTKWLQLHEEWAFANQAARASRHRIAEVWEARARGQGPQLTPDMLERALQLERTADDTMLAIEAHLKAAFSGDHEGVPFGSRPSSGRRPAFFRSRLRNWLMSITSSRSVRR